MSLLATLKGLNAKTIFSQAKNGIRPCFFRRMYVRELLRKKGLIYTYISHFFLACFRLSCQTGSTFTI